MKILKRHILTGALGLSFMLPVCSQDFSRPIAMEGIELYSMITFGAIDAYEVVDPGLHLMNSDDNYNIKETENALIRGVFKGGAVYNDGKIYCNYYDNESNVQKEKPIWRIYDAKTFSLISEFELGDNCQYTTTSLAYDETSDYIYGYIEDYTDTYLAKIMPENGTMEKITRLDALKKYNAIGCTSSGLLYGVTEKVDPKTGEQTQELVRFRKTDGMEVKVGNLVCDNLLSEEDLLVNMNYDQALFYNNSTKKMYWIFGSSSYKLSQEYLPVMEVNLLNAKVEMIGYLSKTYHISGAFLMQPESMAPSIIEDFQFIPDQKNINIGKLSFTMPAVSYGGDELTDNLLSIVVRENGEVVIEGQAAPGDVFESEYIEFTNEMHNLEICVSNDEGDGPVVKRSFFAGYDLPAEPTDARLTVDGLTTTLTWKAPEIGINGYPINKENLSYKVVRYPYEITVAEGLKDCSFVETHPEDMTRYVYTVFAYDGEREGGWTFSNNLIVGTPLSVPYGGIFNEAADMYNYYTLIDSNSDGYSWSYDQNTASAVYVYNEKSAADDWMIAPPINYKGGTEYILKFMAYSSMASYPESLVVTFGDERTPEEQNIVLLDIPEVPSVDEDNPVQEFSAPITVDEDGIYYFGFHVTSPAFHEFLYIFDIRLEEKGGTSVADIDNAGFKCFAAGNTLYVNNPERENVMVYDAAGKLIFRSGSETVERQFEPGIYMVSAGDRTEKVVVY